MRWVGTVGLWLVWVLATLCFVGRAGRRTGKCPVGAARHSVPFHGGEFLHSPEAEGRRRLPS